MYRLVPCLAFSSLIQLIETSSVLFSAYLCWHFSSLSLCSLAQGHALALAFARHLRWSLRPGTPARKSPRDPYCYSPSRALRDEVSAIAQSRNQVPFRPQSRKCMGMAKVSRRAGAHPDVQKDSRKPLLLLGCRVSANIRIIRFRDLHVHASPGGVSTGRDREITD